ncbi:MAG TPA: Zn-dependent alcohol dehydrogenase [Candidatus Binatia bacterium]|jgi:S-(hydroxymethyl)glutathione dehydrogenase/alcohol dehydrogenase|nr:Zn-dependent alcohol dehydrogenase [Candidatus Binatia bacterium]
MKGAVFHGGGRPVAIEDVRVKDPGPGEVRVAVKAAGLCHSDLSVIDGSIPYPVPVVLGHEGAGVVEALGPGVRSVKEGDAVVLSTLAHCGRCRACEVGRPTECRNAPNPKETQPFVVGGRPAHQFANASAFVEKTVVREQSAIPIDPRVPFDRAALIGCGIMTGVGAVVNRARVETGATMAVFGLGGIGLSCVQGGVLAGAARIVAVDVVAEKLALARRLGATDAIDATTDDPVAAVKALTGGGADYTFEAVGSLAVIRQALDALGPGGTLTIVGVPKLGSSLDVVVHQLYQNKAILGCRYGAARPRRDFPMLADLYLAGRLEIDALVTQRYALDDFARALDDLRAGRLARGVFRLDKE